jgi:hypothetical protein
MANTQDQRVDRIAANAAAPDSEKPKVDRVARAAKPGPKKSNTAQGKQPAGAKAAPERSAWLKRLDSYDRHERREFQVTRYG